ncbi:MAG: Na-K-Cl cotransporter [Acidobacteriota bacterium]|nr:Na-K-Cl cotransporter [Acidobacteriota bacterium]
MARNAAPTAKPATNGSQRFGAFGGVFTPSILTILGVVMYLRLGWVVGNAGLGGALLIVVLAHVISVITGLSVSSIATNRTVGAGGAYFMISRSLGGAAGAAIGIPLFFAQALSIAFYVVGFSESLGMLSLDLDPRLVGTGVCVVLTLISLKGTDLAIKAQYFVMAAIGISLVSFFVGRSPSPPEEIAWLNPEGLPFATVFAVFFPAVTGIMAGVSMSGDLREPRRDLPRGTMSAIGVGFLVYLAVPVWLAVNADSSTLTSSLRVMWDVSRVPALIFVGVWAATLSSAIGSILAAPRTLQALAVDGFMPRLLGRGSGPANEPRIGLVFSFALAEVAILLGGLDVIARILTMFFLATYGVTNLACGLEKWAASPSFRPSLSVPWWVSLIGAVGCFYVMSIIDLVAMGAALVVCAGIYFIAQRKSLNNTFGDARHGILAGLVRSALHHYRRAQFHPVNWRPNLIIFGGTLARRAHLAELGSALVQDRGIVSYSQLIEGGIADGAEQKRDALELLEEQVKQEFPNLFCRVDVVDDIHRGLVQVAQSYGVGNFEANTVMFGWTDKPERQEALLSALRDLLLLDRSALIVSYNRDRGLGVGRRIDIWWGGLERNGALMLLLAYLLNSHDRWREAEVRILTVVSSEKKRIRAEKELAGIMEQTRLAAETRVLVRRSADISEIMREESGRSDLVMVGLRQPKPEEKAADFFVHYARILEALPTTMLVASAPSFEGAPVLFDDTDVDEETNEAGDDVPANEARGENPRR